MPTIKQFDITLSDINFLLDQLRHTILVVGYNGQGQAIYGYRDPASPTGYHELGLFGSFDSAFSRASSTISRGRSPRPAHGCGAPLVSPSRA